MGHEHIGPPPFPLTTNFLAEMRREADIYRITHGDLLPDTKDWRYLEHRWQIDPSRFDKWHPLIGQWITENWNLTHVPPPPPVVCPPPHITTAGGTPEPSSVMLLAVGIVLVLIWRRCHD